MGISAAAASEKTIDKLTSDAWTSATNNTRAYFEATYQCCGFFNVTDRTVLCGDSAGSGVAYSSSDGEGAGCRDAIYGVVKRMTSKVTVGAFVILLFQGAILFVTVLLSLRIKAISSSYSSITQFDDGDDEIEVGLGSNGSDSDLSLGEYDDDDSDNGVPKEKAGNTKKNVAGKDMGNNNSNNESDGDDDDYVNDPDSLLE